MNINKFLAYHGLTENPFVAEEARHDPVYAKLLEQTGHQHPDFAKILGRVEQPSTSVVFGEKGSGKTAIRLMIGRCHHQHNQQNPERRVMLVAYDNLNPMLDQLTQRRRLELSALKRSRATVNHLLELIRLEDHQDAIISLATTRLLNALLGVQIDGEPGMLLPENWKQRLRKLPRRQRIDLLVLAALYDQPRSGDVGERWDQMRKALRITTSWSTGALQLSAAVLTVAALLIGGAFWVQQQVSFFQNLIPDWVLAAAGAGAALALLLWFAWLLRQWRVWRLSRELWKQTPAITRTVGQLRALLIQLRPGDLNAQPWPTEDSQDRSNCRYELTGKLMDILEALSFKGLLVLVDRVDEPTLIAGQADRMRLVVWPMFDNKFLQQERVGLKLLLPIELRHLLHRETSEFFQEARLDKQSLVDRLEWSGATLYDLCTARVRACRQPGEDQYKILLTDLFEPSVSRELLVDALDQMHQPRDAFKFLYAVLQEHCRIVPEDQAKYLIPKLTLESVRRTHAQRVQELYRGLAPA